MVRQVNSIEDDKIKKFHSFYKAAVKEISATFSSRRDLRMSFLLYNSLKDEFQQIGLINTSPLYSSSKKHEKKTGSFYYARKAINNKETQVGYNVLAKSSPWGEEIKKSAEKQKIKSVISTPVIYKNEPLGVINFFSNSILKNRRYLETKQIIANCELIVFLIIKSIENEELQSINTQNKIIPLLLEAFDPQKLSYEEFDRDKYLKSIIKSVGVIFNIKYIILRLEDQDDSELLKPVASYGFEGNDPDLEGTEVRRGFGIAGYLELNLERHNFYYTDDLQNDKLYQNTTFAIKKDFKPALSNSIVVDGKFVGFIMYFKKTKDVFNKVEIDFLKNHLSNIVQRILVFTTKLSEDIKNIMEDQRRVSLLTAYLLNTIHTAKNKVATTNIEIYNMRSEIKNLQLSKNEKEPLNKLFNKFSEDFLEIRKHLETTLKEFKSIDTVEIINDVKLFIEKSILPIKKDIKIYHPGIKISFSCHKYPSKIEGKKRLLSQVFYNIVLNSVEAIVEKKNQGDILIKISDTLEKEKVMISIVDDGIGVPERELENIFSSIYSTKIKAGGSGYGLNLCKKIIKEHHHGEINAKNIKNGLRIDILLPKTFKHN